MYRWPISRRMTCAAYPTNSKPSRRAPRCSLANLPSPSRSPTRERSKRSRASFSSGRSTRPSGKTMWRCRSLRSLAMAACCGRRTIRNPDSAWPISRQAIERQMRHLSPEMRRKVDSRQCGRALRAGKRISGSIDCDHCGGSTRRPVEIEGVARTIRAPAPGPALLFYLRRRTTFGRQGDVGERRVVRGSMPMFLFGGNVHDIAWDDDLLLRVCGNDALARGHEQHLIATMSVHFVTRTRTEVDDAQIEVVARLGREQRLPRHRTTGEQGSVHGLSWDLAGFVYLHLSFSSQAIVPSSFLARVYPHLLLFQEPARPMHPGINSLLEAWDMFPGCRPV